MLMKHSLKLEALGIFSLITAAYFHIYPESRGLYFLLFFIPDLSFAAYLISKKWGAIAYNILHHQGIWAVLLIVCFFTNEAYWIKVSIIFLAHSAFDRVWGYGLKYFDGFEHTHLGWIGKS